MKEEIARLLQHTTHHKLVELAQVFGVKTSFVGKGGTRRYLRSVTLRERIKRAAERKDVSQKLLTYLRAAGHPENMPEIPMEPPQEKESTPMIDRAIRDLMEERLSTFKPGLDEARVQDMIKTTLNDMILPTQPTVIEVKTPDGSRELEGLHHKDFEKLLRMVSAGVNVWLVGGAGSGKTLAAQNVAKALGLPFRSNGAIDSEYKLSGFVDANGRIHSTAFRDAFTNGGVFLFDEVDVSLPSAILAFNAALSNDYQDFPGETEPVKRHPDFRCIAAANTLGHGACSTYVGRAQMDGAFLDRFVFLQWEYDAALEVALSTPEIAQKVQRIRKVAEEKSMRVIISPRASIAIHRMISAGMDEADAFDAAVWSRLPKQDRETLEAEV